MRNKLTLYFLSLLGVVLLFNSCKKEYEDINTIDDRKIQEYISKNGLSMTKDPSGFYYQIISPGTGALLQNTDSVFFNLDYKALDGTLYFQTAPLSNAANYVGYLSKSVNPTYPGDVYRTVMTKVGRGGKIKVIIPSFLAFGKNGAGNVPSNEIITSDVSVYSEAKQADIDNNRITTFLAEKGISASAIKLSSSVYRIITTSGTSPDAIDRNSLITVKYKGRLLNGTVFDETGDGTYQQPLASFIQGWRKALIGISVGSKVRLLIPSELAYANEPKGAGLNNIPINSVLDFDVEIIKIGN